MSVREIMKRLLSYQLDIVTQTSHLEAAVVFSSPVSEVFMTEYYPQLIEKSVLLRTSKVFAKTPAQLPERPPRRKSMLKVKTNDSLVWNHINKYLTSTSLRLTE